MKKQITLIIAGLFTWVSFAHNPDVSSIMLVEKENNTWVLQVNAALTAFQREIRTHFTETPYGSPEEFQQMVLEHTRNNLEISFNHGKQITLDHGLVKLGHETIVVFEVNGIPEDIQTVQVKNTTFEDINRSQSAFMLFKQGFSKDQFVLNNVNNHSIALAVQGNKFVEDVTNKASFFSPYLGLIFIGLFGAGYICYYAFGHIKMRLRTADKSAGQFKK